MYCFTSLRTLRSCSFKETRFIRPGCHCGPFRRLWSPQTVFCLLRQKWLETWDDDNYDIVTPCQSVWTCFGLLGASPWTPLETSVPQTRASAHSEPISWICPCFTYRYDKGFVKNATVLLQFLLRIDSGIRPPNFYNISSVLNTRTSLSQTDRASAAHTIRRGHL